MTTTAVVLISAAAVVVVFALWAGIPLWMVRKHPDLPPDNELPEYLRLRHEHIERGHAEDELVGSRR